MQDKGEGGVSIHDNGQSLYGLCALDDDDDEKERE